MSDDEQETADTSASSDGTPPDTPSEFGSIDGTALLDEVRAWFGRFVVVVRESDLVLLALWTVHTFLFRELYTSPRLLIDSITPESGKTTVLDHLNHLCRNSMLAVSMSSAALIPRLVDQEPTTVLLDEIQRTLIDGSPETAGVMAVINSGYRDGAVRPVLVRTKGGGWEPLKLSTFAPVAMAGNAPRLEPDTLSRSIRILLMPDIDGMAEDSDWELLDADAEQLRERISEWADSVRAYTKVADGKLPPGCVSRLREKWRPLKKVAELADETGNFGGGSQWSNLVWQMAEEDLADMKAQREAGLTRQTPTLVLLQDLAAIWPANTPFMATEVLIELLVAHNADYWDAGVGYGGNPRRRLNATRLGRMIKQATNAMSREQVKGSVSRRPGGGGTPRGYERAQFERAWKSLRITPQRHHEADSGAQN